MRKTRWVHRNFRDVEFEVDGQSWPNPCTLTLVGSWIRKDFGCGELVLSVDIVNIKVKDLDNWRIT